MKHWPNQLTSNSSSHARPAIVLAKLSFVSPLRLATFGLYLDSVQHATLYPKGRHEPFRLTNLFGERRLYRSPIGVGANGENYMPASKRLPAHFGEIDPNSPFSVKRFFTALAATGHIPWVTYFIDEDRVRFEMDFPVGMTRLQQGRLARLVSWQQNKDPNGQRQKSYLCDLMRSISFAPRVEGDGSRYFRCPLA